MFSATALSSFFLLLRIEVRNLDSRCPARCNKKQETKRGMKKPRPLLLFSCEGWAPGYAFPAIGKKYNPFSNGWKSFQWLESLIGMLKKLAGSGTPLYKILLFNMKRAGANQCSEYDKAWNG
jgi:hypothetical protein